MTRNPVLHSPAPDEPLSLSGFVVDLAAGIAMMAFVIAATLVLAGVAS